MATGRAVCKCAACCGRPYAQDFDEYAEASDQSDDRDSDSEQEMKDTETEGEVGGSRQVGADAGQSSKTEAGQGAKPVVNKLLSSMRKRAQLEENVRLLRDTQRKAEEMKEAQRAMM